MTIDTATVVESATLLPRLPQALSQRIDIRPVVDALRPLIRAHEKEMEVTRRLPEQVIAALYETGTLDAQLPREFNGIEIHPADHVELLFELGRINGSVAWVAMIIPGNYPLFPETVQRELMSRDEQWRTASSSGRHGTAVRVDGGYRFTGHWVFSSASAWANYFCGYAQVFGADGTPEDDPVWGGPLMIHGLFFKDDVEYLDRWDALGLKGTGSGEWKVNDLFVPEKYTGSDSADRAYSDRPFFRDPSWNGQLQIAATILGCAQSAIDAFIEVAATKRANNSFANRAALMGHGELHAVRLATAVAKVRSALEWAKSLAVRAMDAAESGNELSYEEASIEMQHIPMFAGVVSREVADILFGIAGADAVRPGPLQRAIRDAMTAGNHTAVIETGLRPVGQYYLTKDWDGGPVMDLENSLIMPPPESE
ncbi:acyl-CoA dehydrogenase family protein [Leifsonia kafniensis]|uniref:Acyl-CoA dehydrogenase family protein n=1 Tax=Leifsonia kafniensis TaxID=475957 RepID=A0ABP7KLR5_9MICO